jgi:hypothetical protein
MTVLTANEKAVKACHARKRFFKESPRHARGKLLLCKIFRDRGFKTEVERRFHCPIPGSEVVCRYQVDVYAERASDTLVRRIIAEVDGYIGHKTNYAIAQQGLRSRRIRERFGSDIEIYRFTFDRLTKWTPEEIATEMNI